MTTHVAPRAPERRAAARPRPARRPEPATPPLAVPPDSAVAGDPAGWLRIALGGLVEATDAMTMTVAARDLAGLAAAVERAEQITGALGRAAPVLGELRDDPRLVAAGPELAALRDRIRENGRRNAHLIQRAWELDAAAVRLLVRLVAPAGDGPAVAYAAPAPRLLDTPA
jgi:hypothetical protein